MVPVQDDRGHNACLVTKKKLRRATPRLLQVCLEAYLLLSSPVKTKPIDREMFVRKLQRTLKLAGHPAGDGPVGLPPPMPRVTDVSQLLDRYRPFGGQLNLVDADECWVMFRYAGIVYRYHLDEEMHEFVFVSRVAYSDN
jgi:hypothetical protein